MNEYTGTETAQDDEHRAADSFDLNGKWVTACTCGLRFTSSTPSGAYGGWQKHTDREGRSTVQTAAPTPARAKHCGCGCGEPLAPRAGGLFRSGHDARYKSVLTAAHTAGQKVRHPLTGDEQDALAVAAWLDERRGGGDFWQKKVLAGHKPQPERKPRAVQTPADTAARSIARVDAIMEFNATRRPVPGDIGVVTLRSGVSYGARVIRRTTEDALELKFLDGPSCGTQIVTGDHRFKRGGR